MNTAERAKIAQEFAANATTTARAYGLLFESLLACLKDNNILSDSKIKLVFLGAAATIDEMQPQNELQSTAQRAMRDTVVHSALAFGIQIPPPGQTGMPRRH